MREWLKFSYLCVVWGAAFFWIKVAVDELAPFTLVAMRLVLASIGLLALMRLRRQRWPRDLKTNQHLLVMAFLSPMIPLVLITWAETRIDSAVASILNAMVPLATIVFAHFFLEDEPLTRSRLGGLIVGFLGVVVLMGRGINPSAHPQERFVGYLVVVLSACFYGASAVYSRLYLKHVAPVTHAAGNIAYAAAVSLLGMALVEWPPRLPQAPMTWAAVLWLGLLSTCSGFAVYYSLLPKWGATRSSLVNYVIPVIGVVLGVVCRGELVDWHLIAGSSLILSGIGIVNHRVVRELLSKKAVGWR